MVSRRTALPVIAGAFLVGCLGWSLLAQPGEPGAEGKDAGRGRRGEGPGGPGGRGGFDPAQFRQFMLDRMKETLGATDEEWKVLSPRVEKVMDAQRDAMAGGMGGFMRGGPGGRGPGGRGPTDSANQSPLAKAAEELRTLLDNKQAPADDIGKKLTAFRQARDKAREDQTKAQKALRELLTQRQEATLVLMGTLD